MLIVVSILIILFFIPIPIKFSFIYNNKSLNLYIYDRKISLKSIKEHATRSINKLNDNNNNIKKLLLTLEKNKFKPILDLSIKINYGFEDASITAISYGLIQMLCSVNYPILINFFNVKAYKFELNPKFNKELLKIQIKSIIWISIAKTIFIFIKFTSN